MDTHVSQRGNSVVDKDATPTEGQMTAKTELHFYK
jgi:hypothetical protein